MVKGAVKRRAVKRRVVKGAVKRRAVKPPRGQRAL